MSNVFSTQCMQLKEMQLLADVLKRTQSLLSIQILQQHTGGLHKKLRTPKTLPRLDRTVLDLNVTGQGTPLHLP